MREQPGTSMMDTPIKGQSPGKPLRLLLIEDNPGDERLFRELIRDITEMKVDVTSSSTLADAEAHLAAGSWDVVLLDLNLPDSSGLETFHVVSSRFTAVPIVVLTGVDNSDTAVAAIQHGAQDYLIKGSISNRELARVLRYAIERQRLQNRLLSMSRTDELTGLCNRRGFFERAERQMKLARRQERDMVLLYIDLDNFKSINDREGHRAGDRLLAATAGVLRNTFRETDILARLGGDEFVVLAVDTTPGADTLLLTRLFRQAAQLNDSSMDAKIGFSAGAATWKAASGEGLEKLISRADREMYRMKMKGKRNTDTQREVSQ